jgi:alkylated DNA repair dioxygenase AlkB
MRKPDLYLNPRFIDDPDDLLEWLHTGVTWDERMKARKTASFGVAYNYSQIAYAEQPMPPQLALLGKLVSDELGFLPNNCLINCYPNGESSMGFHSDSTGELEPGTGVAIVSVGAVRSIVYRNKQDRSTQFDYPLEHGSLLYMNQQVQDEWLHAIPKSDAIGERISLTFRSMRHSA